ncbi:GNAT family N-acetyltransferase [Dinoroseobacter sp. S76]|uniref:GNAT family N-acetyltransferase n=1 Tax=Dinoroseobacter sp. S76 TaxID=3415124 RepID=UPI003C7C76C6
MTQPPLDRSLSTRGPRDVTLHPGFPEDQRDQAAILFWQAFHGKLHRILTPEEKALGFLRRVADPTFAISALSPEGRLLGVAGFKTAGGGFMGGELSDLQAVFGRFGGLWRGIALSVLERPVAPGILLMDGIMVDPVARGQGIGQRLLTAIKARAGDLGCNRVRLDVIDTNPRARALYTREGFVAGETAHLGPLRYIFGFRAATTMTYTL